MNLKDCTTIDQLEAFLKGTQSVAYTVLNSKDERYQWIQKALIRFRYIRLTKREKGIVIRFLMKVSGYSRQQVTRLIKQYRKTGKIRRQQQTVHGFAQRYTNADIRLIATMDEDHNQPCGAIIKKLCERAWHHYHDPAFERLASISVSHIYNLRKTFTYKKVRQVFTQTQSKTSPIGERRKPNPEGKPGYLRVDSVHQGDQDKVKGVYHINLVDETTQITICCAVEKISERYMVPALESMFGLLPFEIRGFHSDNGSEYINKTVAKLLDKLRIEFTKSRSRRSNDNALAESKNASVIRKNFGYSHISQRWADDMNRLIQEPLYIYQNFHRPCFFPSTKLDKKGKEKKVYDYKNMMTPCEKLLSIPNVEDYLKPGVTPKSLQAIAEAQTDSQAAKTLQEAKRTLFKKIFATA